MEEYVVGQNQHIIEAHVQIKLESPTQVTKTTCKTFLNIVQFHQTNVQLKHVE